MGTFFRFLGTGLVLGLLTEFEFKIVAGLKPATFLIVLVAYPIFLALAFGFSGLLDRLLPSRWLADLTHYFGCGVAGLAVEWTLLSNGPGSNAFQLGMFAMWTTFCFGPRVLIRKSARIDALRRRFWIAFWVFAVVLTIVLLVIQAPQARIVIAVVALSGSNIVWSAWMLVLARRS